MNDKIHLFLPVINIMMIVNVLKKASIAKAEMMVTKRKFGYGVKFRN